VELGTTLLLQQNWYWETLDGIELKAQLAACEEDAAGACYIGEMWIKSLQASSST